MKKEIKIGNTKINFKFKLGWKEASKKERIVAILGYLVIAGIIFFCWIGDSKMENIKPRGVKKGETPQWKVGRKATGLKRNKSISFKVTEEEREKIYDILDKIGGTRTDALLKLLGYKKWEPHKALILFLCYQ